MTPMHADLLKRNAQAKSQWHAWRSPFIVRASLMFGVPCGEVTLAQYAAAVERTKQDTPPPQGVTP